MKHLAFIILLFLLSIFLVACWKAQIVGGPISNETLKDGTYTGDSKNGPNSVVVQIEIKDQKIVGIEVLKNTGWKGKRAVPEIPNRIIDQQSTRVDAVTGATNSSNVIMNAVQDAVQKAQINN